MRIIVIHGPNLNLLGERQPEVYGTQPLAKIDAALVSAGKELGVEVFAVQLSSEGAIIDQLHAARNEYDAVVINPGAYAHYSYAIADAISSIRIPVIEVHITNVAGREPHRRVSVTAAACVGTVSGFGARSYVLALRAARDILGK